MAKFRTWGVGQVSSSQGIRMLRLLHTQQYSILEDIISFEFNWRATMYGHDYWAEKHKKLCEGSHPNAGPLHFHTIRDIHESIESIMDDKL